MSDTPWLTADETQTLQKDEAPLRYIEALGDLRFRPHNAKRHNFSPRYGIFDLCSARRTLKGAQRALFEMREALTPRLGPSRSIKDPTGSEAIWVEWRSLAGWTLSVSADEYPYDPEWFTTAVLVHRRFTDRASQTEMARQVKICLWGSDEKYWPGRPYMGPVFKPIVPRARTGTLADQTLDLRRAPKSSAQPESVIAAEPSLKAGNEPVKFLGLEDLFIND